MHQDQWLSQENKLGWTTKINYNIYTKNLCLNKHEVQFF